jgi:hypothetical protein
MFFRYKTESSSTYLRRTPAATLPSGDCRKRQFRPRIMCLVYPVRRSKLSEQYTMGKSSSSASQTTNAHDRSTEPMLICGFGRVATRILEKCQSQYRTAHFQATYQNTEHVEACRGVCVLVRGLHVRLVHHCRRPGATFRYPWEVLVVRIVLCWLYRQRSVDAIKTVPGISHATILFRAWLWMLNLPLEAAVAVLLTVLLLSLELLGLAGIRGSVVLWARNGV